MRTFQTTALLAALIVASGGSFASNQGQLVHMEVLPRSHGHFQSFYQAGQSWVAGEQNEEFRLRLRNTSNERVMVVLSIDGVNAVSGQTAGFEQPGYVLSPYQTLDVNGWRKSSRSTAAFYFTHIANSYAARTHRPENVGVIGAAVFREQRYYIQQPYGSEYGQDYGDYSRDYPSGYGERKSHEPAPHAEPNDGLAKRHVPSAPGGAPLGTGHGRREYSQVRTVDFERENNPSEVLSVRYDSLRNLIALGVAPRHYRSGPNYGVPAPFPRSEGYVADPPSYGYRSRVR